MANMKIDFGRWFFHGYDGSPKGYQRIFSGRKNIKWLIIHLATGFLLSELVDSPMKEVARVVLLPLIAVIIGLTFAWAGNAQGFFQSKEIIEISKNKAGGYIDYIFVYQLSIFIVLLCSIMWSLLALDYKEINLFGQLFHPKYLPFQLRQLVKVFIYTITGITLREAWSVIQGVHYFLIARNIMFEENEKNKTNK